MEKLLDRLVASELKKKRLAKLKRRITPIWFQVNLEGDEINRFKGVNVGYDVRFKNKGFFVYSGSAMSEKYHTMEEIPESVIQRIKQTR